MTIHIATNETPFRLTFGQHVVILVEISQPLECIANYSKETNDWLKVENLDFLKQDREMAHIGLVTYK